MKGDTAKQGNFRPRGKKIKCATSIELTAILWCQNIDRTISVTLAAHWKKSSRLHYGMRWESGVKLDELALSYPDWLYLKLSFLIFHIDCMCEGNNINSNYI